MIPQNERDRIPFDAVNPLRFFKPNELGSQHPVAPGPIGIKAPPVKLIDISFPDGLARTMTICLGNPSIATTAGTFQVRGPLVGIVEWGVGGGNNRIEFNIPPSFLWGPNGSANPAVPGDRAIQGTNGVQLAIAGSSFQVSARNDQNITPVNGPVGATIGAVIDGINPQVNAFIGQWNLTKQQSPIQRVIPVVSTGGTSLAAGANVTIGIPAFAKRVRFMRQPIQTTPLELTIATAAIFAHSAIAVPVQSVGPVELTPYDFTIAISNAGAVAITSLIAVFDLEV